MSVEENYQFLISEEEEGERLDKILAKRFNEIKSRKYFQDLIENEKVWINGELVKKRTKLKAQDEISIDFIKTQQIDLEPQNIPLEIIFEDENIIVVNKPAGMVVHPAPGHWSGTFVNALLYHCKELLTDRFVVNTKESYPRPGVVHRLDKDTTGLLIAAKTSLAHERLVEMFTKREIYKEYLAICIGKPANQQIKTKIGRHPYHRKLMSVVEEGGKDAITICQTISYNEKFSLIKVILETGRTHQIRVHMKHIGTPILGCPLYGNHQVNKREGVSRQMLHASLLKFNHPITHASLEFKVDMPDQMKSIVPLNF